MEKIIILLISASLFFTPIEGTLVYADGENITVGNTKVFMDLSKEEILNLTLQEAIDFALKENRDLLVKKLELAKADISYSDQIRGVRALEKNPESITERDESNFFTIAEDASIIKALVKNGARRRGVELTYNIAKWNLEMKENQVKYNVEKAYFDLLQIEQELQIAKENLFLVQNQYKLGKLRFSVGMISEQQLIGLDFTVSQAQSAFDTANMYYGLQKLSFRNTVGLPLDKEFELTDSLETREYDEIDTEEAIKTAFEENASLKIANENYELAGLSFEATKVKYPDITYKYREQAEEVAKAEQTYLQAKNGVEIQVRSAIWQLHNAEKQIATYKKAVEQAANGVRIAELSFELGMNTFTDISQANINLMNAKKNLAQQIHAFNMALLDYRYSIGLGKGM